jgi:hypothetical protein
VFTTTVGTPVEPRNDYRQFKQLLAPSVRLHDLRHTAASLLTLDLASNTVDVTKLKVRQ